MTIDFSTYVTDLETTLGTGLTAGIGVAVLILGAIGAWRLFRRTAR